ncbi:ATP-binding protein [Paludibaculum fermentans]|uniref:ATP-binding protein n=2 Tax=Paludibaculum fermentans TaxID=1473598 RepID=A0A7S7NS17_PALFE|nr:ATP-binding protein [Paludibaculum fermentans]
MQEQLVLICREAFVNAMRHSQATSIEVEIQYRGGRVQVFVRDNGCGINPLAVEEATAHGGLCVMRNRAKSIGARFGIWSRPGAGTEVLVAVALDSATGAD